ncbi:GntR family transcriptional regulator [Aminicella lysinilytica]|uniref:DNA-binding GntR family transcriptional regulator n=1 Tax=Aminicella lysinilytica TaxID=433323 RepID=A0A4R6PYM9_9FIRM|nr:GntR family transcriptional regulator [Aminicella lysinilytica]TDP49825.1 DNA-binding GntR family transcriptional regulator [Aminicella lysinilytica]
MIEYKSVSLANQVFETLERNILNGTYPIGEVISEKRLSEELGVSRTPIREALNRLADEDLIKDSPMGNVVLGITDKDVDDTFEVRRRIEIMATRWAAKAMTKEQLDEMKNIIDQQEFYASKDDVDKVRDLDTEFHDLIYDSCGSPVVRSVLMPLHHKMHKFRKASLAHEHRMIESIEEHRNIYNAIIKGDEKKVESIMLTHIDHAYQGMKDARVQEK